MKKISVLVLFLLIGLFRFTPCFADDSDLFGTGSSASGSSAGKGADSFESSIFGKTLHSGNSPLKTLQQYDTSAKGSSNFSTSGAKDLSAVNPEKYRLQAGDRLLVQLWTPSFVEVDDIISPFGTINVPGVGFVSVKGVPLARVSAYLNAELKKYYKSVRVLVNLTDVRLIKVEVLGEVKQPGVYEVAGTSGALDILDKLAGGLLDTGSLRGIEVREDDKLVRTLDYFKWRSFGDQDQNSYLEPNQVVYVPIAKTKVVINGEIRRPGTYELLPGETLGNLLKMAGEYSTEAVPKEAKISRRGNRSEREIVLTADLPLIDGDVIYIPPRSLFERRIKVIGEVRSNELLKPIAGGAVQEFTRIGWYQLREHERVTDVLLNLGGLTSRADPSRVRLERKDSKGELQIIPIDVHKLFMHKESASNLELQEGDTLVVPPEPESVFLIGEVSRPGVFPYNAGYQIREYIASAGGPTRNAVLAHTKVIRTLDGSQKTQVYTVNVKKLMQPNSKELNFYLEPGDIVFIPRTEVASFFDIITVLGDISILRALTR